MKSNNWLSARNDAVPVPLDRIPELLYPQFAAEMEAMLADTDRHCVAYFAVPHKGCGGLRFFGLVACDDTGEVLIASHTVDYYHEGRIDSLAARVPALHVYEREISELYGVRFHGHPWPKPLRYHHLRLRQEDTMDNYPFYQMETHDLHQVNVGPVHAGIIEPGAFRFLCDGERIMHLEIALGYQHRGVESLITGTKNRLRQIALGESIAGDTAIGHSVAMARILEAGYSEPRDSRILDCERAIALEMERMAMHIADTGALCMDMAYQTGHVACEALRTLVINSMQSWCGNRFGKGLIRPFGTHYRLSLEQIEGLEKTLAEVAGRYRAVGRDLLTTPSVLSRLEHVCIVTRQQALQVGAVGMAARMAGIPRDARKAHNFWTLTGDEPFVPEFSGSPNGDLLRRLKIRLREVEASFRMILQGFKQLRGRWFEACPEPEYDNLLSSQSLLFSLVEGWRGEICHVAMTNDEGQFSAYKIYDPSVHNWMMLALSVRNGQISDFPVSNKSFNLSYCGHDL